MNQYHIDARQRHRLPGVSDRAAMGRTVRPCRVPPPCPHHRSSTRVSKEGAAAVGRTAERDSDSSNAICRQLSWIIEIIHETGRKMLADMIIGGESCRTTSKPLNHDVEPPSVRHEECHAATATTLGLTVPDGASVFSDSSTDDHSDCPLHLREGRLLGLHGRHRFVTVTYWARIIQPRKLFRESQCWLDSAQTESQRTASLRVATPTASLPSRYRYWPPR